MSEDLDSVLTEIDIHFSRKYHIHMLKFLANSVVAHGLLEECNSVPTVYKKMTESKTLRNHKESVAVALLRHMLHVTGYKREKINLLDAYCSEEFVLTTVAPSLPFYEVLLLLASKLVKNNHYKEFLSSVDENKLNKSRHDISSPVDLFQSMILEKTLDPDKFSTLNEVVTMLEASGMTEESQFMRQSIFNQSGTAEIAGEEGLTVSVAVYYNHKGLPDSANSQGIDYECMNAFWTFQAEERRSLNEDKANSDTTSNPDTYTSSRIEHLKCKVCRTAFSGCVMLILIIGTVITFPLFVNSTSQELNHVQPVYGPLVFAPFCHLDQFYYSSIETSIKVDQKEDLDLYNLTVCKVPCPLQINVTHSQVTGECPADRLIPNCYANVFGYPNPGTDAQYFSRYMLNNSNITFVITELSRSQNITIPLCITMDKAMCNRTFVGASGKEDCHEVLEFNTSNDYTRTFTTRNDSYYCAVWLLPSNLSLTYTLNSTLQFYQIPSADRSHSECKNFQNSKSHTFYLRYGIALKIHDYTCLLVEQNGSDLNRNITISITTVTSVKNIAFVIGMILAILLVSTILFVAIFHHRML